MKSILWFVRLVNIGVYAMCAHLMVYDFSFLDRIRMEKLFSGGMVVLVFSLGALIRIIMFWIDQERKEKNNQTEIDVMARARKEFVFYGVLWLLIYLFFSYHSSYYLPGLLKQ